MLGVLVQKTQQFSRPPKMKVQVGSSAKLFLSAEKGPSYFTFKERKPKYHTTF